jgi:hypothetical protein
MGSVQLILENKIAKLWNCIDSLQKIYVRRFAAQIKDQANDLIPLKSTPSIQNEYNSRFSRSQQFEVWPKLYKTY